MTSRERILTTIRHHQPDRVPVDLGATPSSTLSAIAYTNLAKHLGLKESQTRIYDVVQELAVLEDWALDKFGVDVIDIGYAYNTLQSDWQPVILTDGSQAYYPTWFNPRVQPDGSLIAHNSEGIPIAKKPAGATFFDQICFPYIDGYPDNYKDLSQAMSRVQWGAFAPAPWDHASDVNFWTDLRQKAIKLRQTTDKALLLGIGCNLFEWGTFLRRIDNFLMDTYADQENVNNLLDALMERHLANLANVCEYVGDVVDIVKFGDDLGMDSGPFMAPEIYAELFKPRHKILCDYTKKHSKMHTMLHSCGSIYQLMPHLIEAGFEIINPIQTSTRDMEPSRLKKEFGRDVTFWGGGIDTRTVLNNGTPAEVKHQVKERLEIFSKGGGYVFNTIHNILPDVPPENILVMFEAIDEFNGTR
jgi:uroporphyrinogen decarboxylase